MNQDQATALAKTLATKVRASTVVENMSILSGVDVETFIAISVYENNRPVKACIKPVYLDR